MTGRRATRIYSRVIDLYLAGEVPLRSFILLFMHLWGVVSPPFRGAASDALHELFAYLEDLDLDDLPDDEEARGAVARICGDLHGW